MKFSFKFSNLFGTVYHKGNLLFTDDGNLLISPVGNRINLYDLRKHKSETLPIESRYNFTNLTLSPNGMLLVAVDKAGKALICNIPHRTVIHTHHFKRPIRDIKFSPNGKYIAVTKEQNLFIFQAPSSNAKQFNPFALEKVFKMTYGETTCIEWSSDSRVIAVGTADNVTKIYALEDFENFSVYTLGSHKDCLVGCFFLEKSLDMCTVSKNGQVCTWLCSFQLEELVNTKKAATENEKNSNEEDDIVPIGKEKTVNEDPHINFFYKRTGCNYLRDVLNSKEGYVTLTAAAFHKKSNILVTGFSNGSFLLHEIPGFHQIHSLTLSNQNIASIAFNNTGDWIALGSEGIGQLVVWEWQTESFVMKQQGHFNNMNCLAYSPDGMYIASGGEDGKVKIWDTSSGFCFVTFTEHTSSVTGITFCQNSKTLVSASTDGTVRAFDLHRYRNFKTYTSPKPTQFSCLAVDHSGEIICAGSQESFEIFVWYLKTAGLLSILAGHKAPVSGISFSPVDLCIVSASWDKTVRLWNLSGSKGARETISLTSDGLSVTYRPDGAELALSTLDGQILFFDPRSSTQTGSIEGHKDLYVGRRETDMITAKSLLKSQAFTTLCYTADGECILAAGRSKNVCIYNVKEKLLLKKFEITCNLSFDGITDFINRRRMTHFGNKALIEERADEESIKISVPGSKKIDKSSRTFRPEFSVTSIQFSPTGRAWAATSTEGLLVYSLDNNLVFDPFDLDIDNTPETVRETLKKENYSQAIMMALRLNETSVIQEVIESIKVDNIQTLAFYLPELYSEKLLRFVVDQLEDTPHLEFYVTWIQFLLSSQGLKLKNRFRANISTLRAMQKSLTKRQADLDRICGTFRYLLDYTLTLGKVKKRKQEFVTEEEEEEADEMELIPSKLSSDEEDMEASSESDSENPNT